MTVAPSIAARNISKVFLLNGRVVHALRDVSLRAFPEEFVSLIGPSGCGKSTFLNIVCGLLQPDEGDIQLLGRTSESRLGRVGYMPQKDLLLPWRKLLDNLILGPEVMGRDREEARREARELLPLFGLEGFEESYPSTLSGGMRQRAALLRTFLCKQDIILLDEPFGALDALTRRQMRGWLMDVWSRFRQTVLFVTHDVDEAIYLSDRIYLLSPRPGRILRELTVDLPRPRDVHIASDDRFQSLRDTILSTLGVS